MRIVFCGTGWLPIVDAIQNRIGRTVVIRDPEQAVADAIRDADIVLPSNARIREAELTAASNLRLIQQPAAGYDGVDLAAAQLRGIPVCNAPNANSDALAEAAVMLLLATARRIGDAPRALQDRKLGVPLGIELRHKTLTLVGRGRSGSRVKTIAEAMGMTVRAIGSDATRADLLAALNGANFVSIHCPLDARTRKMIDAEAIGAMARGAILVNAARGPIVDKEALEAALDDGQLAGAGLDVWWREPWDPEDGLLKRTNVVATPHIGGSTHEAFERIAEIVATNIERLERGEPLEHRVI